MSRRSNAENISSGDALVVGLDGIERGYCEQIRAEPVASVVEDEPLDPFVVAGNSTAPI
jgi:hypothetical protein